MHRAVQVLHYIRMVIQSLHYPQVFVGPVLYAGLYRPCTINWAVQALH